MSDRQRAGRGRTWDPWPCCGDEPDQGRPKVGICRSCQELIDIGKATRKRQIDAGAETYKWVKEWHLWPRYYGDYSFGDYAMGERLERAMFDLVSRLTGPTSQEYIWSDRFVRLLDCHGTHTRYEGAILVSVAKDVRNNLNALDATIREALTSSYAEGKKRGQGILTQLASGEMSMQDFNRQSERKP